MRNENFINIQGWMRKELGLKGNDLLVYAIIYQFSQTEKQRFTGSLNYIADWCGATKQGVLKNINSLIQKGLIVKEEYTTNGVKNCAYSTTDYQQGGYSTEFNGIKHSLTGIKHSLTGYSTEFNAYIDNNIYNNIYKTKDKNKENNKDQNKEKDKEKKETLESLIADFTENEELTAALMEFSKMRKLIKKPLTIRALKILLTRLKDLSQDTETQIKIVNQSIVGNWLSFYPLKEQEKANPGGKTLNAQRYTQREYSETDLTSSATQKLLEAAKTNTS